MSNSRITEIQEILYFPDYKRTPLTILRLYLTVFLHALYIKINLRGNLKKLSPRKLFHNYYHSVIRDTCQENRINSARTVNTEKDEATFNSLKTIAKSTFNYHNDNIFLNFLIRLQAKDKVNSIYSNTNSMEIKIFIPSIKI